MQWLYLLSVCHLMGLEWVGVAELPIRIAPFPTFEARPYLWECLLSVTKHTHTPPNCINSHHTACLKTLICAQCQDYSQAGKITKFTLGSQWVSPQGQLPSYSYPCVYMVHVKFVHWQFWIGRFIKTPNTTEVEPKSAQLTTIVPQSSGSFHKQVGLTRAWEIRRQ